MNSQFSYFRVLLVVSLAFAMATPTLAQTYKVNSGAPDQNPDQNQDQQQSQSKTAGEAKKDNKPQSSEKSIGWGSNIQNARLARAAESALKSGNYAAAVEYAQRAVQAAPGDPQLWFLLGYVARLAGKTQASVDAYDHGLRLNPSSLEGQSGQLRPTPAWVAKRTR